MKRILYILFLCLTISAAGQSVFYVQDVSYNANASDDNTGTDINHPWATWQHAFETADAGDTVYFRGGVWYPTTKPVSGYPITLIAPNSGYGNNGTSDSPIVYMAYPPDYANGNVPILDCQYASQSTTGNIGINIDVAEYLEFHGLTIRNVLMLNTTGNVMGIGMTDCTGTMTFKNIVTHNIGGAGQWYRGFDTLYLQNCDSYLCCDSLDASSPGGDGDGFVISARGEAVDTFKIAYVKGCRAWNVSDDGFDIGSMKQLQIDSCWAWGNGINYYSDAYDGDGYAFKLTASTILADGKRWIRNCVSAYNEVGFGDVNLHIDDYYGPRMYYYNNTSYGDYVPFMSGPAAFDCQTDPAHVIYRNNIAYAYTFDFPGNFNSCASVVPPYIDADHNTWMLGAYNIAIPNPAYSLSDADFVSLDTAELRYSREIDGTLPTIYFCELAKTSDLVDSGIDVGLDYSGSAPDLGWREYSPGPQIIADHTVVDKYTDIPQYYIDQVKQMWLSYPGESHSEAVRIGMGLLEAIDPRYSVSVYNSGTPEAYTSDNLRVSSVAWGDVDTPTGWNYYPAGGGYGEEDWFMTSAAVSQTKSGISYSNSGGLSLSAFGFCWCWDGDVYNISFTNLYIAATQAYIDYCRANGYNTKVFFTTGPVDTMTEGLGWFKHLQYEAIRDSISNDKTRILFDFADILCYDDGSVTPNTRNWSGHIYPWITPTNYGDGSVAHMSNAGCLRLAKAMWWMLARMAGWDGIATTDNNTSQPFTIIGMPDTQSYINLGEPDDSAKWMSQVWWIHDNHIDSNIVFVSHYGDVTDGNSLTEWQFADTGFKVIEAIDMPYGIAPGNHDRSYHDGAFHYENYNTYFGSDRFAGRDYYQGSYGAYDQYNVQFFEAAGMEFMILHLTYSSEPPGIAWADSVLKANPERRAILTSHNIANYDAEQDTAVFDYSGQLIYDGLKDNPNLFLMLCGHYHDSEFTRYAWRADTYEGNTIYTLFSNYQGLNGHIRLMKFFPEEDSVRVTTYSPFLDSFLTDDRNEFIFYYDMDVVADEPQVDSTATDIITFTLPTQTGAATINATNHTVAIEVDYTADITDLTPTITLSYGATIIPASGASRDFTSPLPYTVTAEDGVTYQEWTVTVTQEEEPEPEPVASTGRIVKFNGKIVKR